MSWWRPFSREAFPRNSRFQDLGPLEPRSLGRRLVRAARRDQRQAGPSIDLDRKPPPAPHTAALVAGLPERTRREVALRLQRERRGMLVRDKEWWAAEALAEAHCGWEPEDVGRLFALALDGLDRRRPALEWRLDTDALHLPLAALEELPQQRRGALTGDLLTALVLQLSCCGPFHGGSSGPPGVRDQDRADRTHALLGLRTDEEARLLPAGPYGTAARCGLGTWLYDQGVRDLLARCREVTELRPPYAWLGGTRELLQVAPDAQRALVPLLAAARGGEGDCRFRAQHEGSLSEPAARLLTALAWAACVSGDAAAVRELGLALIAANEGAWGDGPSFFLRGGIAALRALSGKPDVGAHHRALSPRPQPAVRAAREALRNLRITPAWSDPDVLRVPVGDYTATYRIGTDGSVELGFRNARGRWLARVPSRVRRDRPVEYEEAQARLTELRSRVDQHRGALAERLHADPGQPAVRWSATQLDDRTAEPLARALVWQADTAHGPVVGLPARRKGSSLWALRDVRGRLHDLADATPVRLWDPRMADAAELRAWRAALARRRLRQCVPQFPA